MADAAPVDSEPIVPSAADGAGSTAASVDRSTTRAWVVPVILVAGDLLVLQAGIAVGLLVRSYLTAWFPIGIGPEVFLGAHAAVLLLPLGCWLAGMYPGYGRTGVERLRIRVSGTALLFLAIVAYDYLAQNGQWSRGILVASAAFTLIAVPVWDGVARRVLIRRGLWGMPVAVWGPGERREQVVASLREHPEIGWNPIVAGEIPDPAAPPLPGVTLAILVAPAAGAPVPVVTDLLPYPRVVLVPAVDDVQCLWVSVRDMGTHLGLEMRRNLLTPTNRLVKRVLDVAAALLALVASAPIIALAGVAVALCSPGPVFYRQRRAGQNGASFEMIKLRTMVPDADAHLAAVLAASPAAAEEWRRSMKLRRDPRVVPMVGRFLRRFSIDELPQFWNVLRGEMSLVGPRPLPPYHLQSVGADASRLRQQVRPGLTGLSQISGRSTRSVDEQARLDSYYVRNWSLWLDLHILARTVVEVLGGRGAW